MKRKFRFPALVRGVPPHSKEERHCLVSGIGEFEIREVEPADMPIALEAAFHYAENGEYRLLDGELYKSWDDAECLDTERENEDLMAVGKTTLYQAISDEVRDVITSGTVAEWPRGVHRDASKPVRHLEDSGIKVSASGEADLERWRLRFAQRIADHVISGDSLWVRVAEPVLLVDTGAANLILYEADMFRDKRDDLGRHTGMLSGEHGADCKAFSLLDMAAATEVLTAAAARLGREPEFLDTFEIVLPEAIRLDVDRLEFDRLARVAVAHVTTNLTRVKPGGGVTMLEVASSSLIGAWGRLKDYLGGYDPLAGVPEKLEEVFADFIAEVDGFNAIYGPSLMNEKTRDAVSCAWNRWENRAVDLLQSVAFRMAG